MRSNATYNIGFLKDLRRLNVAMTPAKAGIVIIGERDTLIGHSHEDIDSTTKTSGKDCSMNALKYRLHLLRLDRSIELLCHNKQSELPP